MKFDSGQPKLVKHKYSGSTPKDKSWDSISAIDVLVIIYILLQDESLREIIE